MAFSQATKRRRVRARSPSPLAGPDLEMASPPDGPLLSSLFTFCIDDPNHPNGPVELVVHSGAIAGISAPLKAMMEGSMVEGVTKRAIITGIDFDNFHRLCQFAYWRDYLGPSPMKRAEPMASDRCTSPEFFSIDLQRRVDTLSESFKAIKYRLQKPANPGLSLPRLEPSEYDYSPVLMGHAKLYAFAKMYMCEALSRLALYKLQTILCKLETSSAPLIRPIVELIEYAYDEDKIPSDDSKHGLRYLVTLYAATQTIHMGRAPEFYDLIAKGGPFALAYWKLISEQIIGAKGHG